MESFQHVAAGPPLCMCNAAHAIVSAQDMIHFEMIVGMKIEHTCVHRILLSASVMERALLWCALSLKHSYTNYPELGLSFTAGRVSLIIRLTICMETYLSLRIIGSSALSCPAPRPAGRTWRRRRVRGMGSSPSSTLCKGAGPWDQEPACITETTRTPTRGRPPWRAATPPTPYSSPKFNHHPLPST